MKLKAKIGGGVSRIGINFISDETLINILLIIFLGVMIYLIFTNSGSKKHLNESIENFIGENKPRPIENISDDEEYLGPIPHLIPEINQSTDDDGIEGFVGNNEKNNKPIQRDSNGIPTVEFPFKNLFDQNGNKLNIILLAAPFREPNHEQLFQEYKNQTPKLEFMGISSYSEFPGKLTNPYENRYHEKQNHDYASMVSSWLNCFRNPNKYINPIYRLPMLDLSESDLKDHKNSKGNTSIKKEYDFIYLCLKDNDQCTPGWQSHNRNWELAKKCLDIMCGKFGLTGVIIGRENCEMPKSCNGKIKILPFLKYHDFQKELKKARFLFVPNITDASPRVITESLCYDLRLLVNYNILGGWKYVTPETGEYFSNENDIVPALDKLLKNMNKYTPRKHFVENYGKELSGKKLCHFIKHNYPNVVPAANTLEYVTITI
jgi:hypothetical protein